MRLRLRRRTLVAAGAASLGSLSLPAYAGYVEPRLRLHVVHYRPDPPGWPPGQRLRIAALADIHAGSRHMPLGRVREIVAETNALEPDIVVLLGDYSASRRLHGPGVTVDDCLDALTSLRAPFGVHSVLGNHDWWDDAEVQRTRSGRAYVRRALAQARLGPLENEARRIQTPDGPVWILGLGDQLAYALGNKRFLGVHSLPRTLAALTDSAPAILLAHEPDIFPAVPERVALTLSGHTHGGQVRLFGWSPIVPSRYGNRYAYGHVAERQRNLIVSAGLGTSVLPLRLGVPPEIVLVELGGA